MKTALIVVLVVTSCLLVGNYLIDFFFAIQEQKDAIARKKREKLFLKEELDQLDNTIQT